MPLFFLPSVIMFKNWHVKLLLPPSPSRVACSAAFHFAGADGVFAAPLVRAGVSVAAIPVAAWFVIVIIGGIVHWVDGKLAQNSLGGYQTVPDSARMAPIIAGAAGRSAACRTAATVAADTPVKGRFRREMSGPFPVHNQRFFKQLHVLFPRRVARAHPSVLHSDQNHAAEQSDNGNNDHQFDHREAFPAVFNGI